MINTFRESLRLKRAFAFDKHFEQIEGISRVPWRTTQPFISLLEVIDQTSIHRNCLQFSQESYIRQNIRFVCLPESQR